MGYTPDLKKSGRWIVAMSEGTTAFSDLGEKLTRQGITREIVERIMYPVWPYFRPVLPEDKEQIYLDLEEELADFWKDYDEYAAREKKESPDEEVESPITLFYVSLNRVLDSMYDDLKDQT